MAILLASPAMSRAQTSNDVEILVPETTWGFDGKAVNETFTPLHVLVQNPGPKAASGLLKVRRITSLETAPEPPVLAPFDIPPFEERWIQVPVFIPDDYVPFELSWGAGANQKVEVPQARLGDPAIVLLTNPADRPRSSGLLRRFRASLFPPTVTLTDGLGVVFLDSPPNFPGARMQAFFDWLNCGGTVVLLHDEQDQFPKFPTPLTVLNDPREEFAVGAGRVRRLARQAGAVTEAEMRLAGSTRSLKQADRESEVAFADPNRTYNGRFPWRRDRVVLEKLESVARFHRRWWLIYPLAIMYLLALFPGTFAIARSGNGVRRFYIVYLALAVLFSTAFKTLGAVGGGQASRIRSATIAHQFAPGLFNCDQWNCLAAVNGGTYSVSHEASGRLYASSEEFEISHGLITSGPEAKYEIEIPVASTRTVVSRFRATAPPFKVELRKLDFVDQRLSNCSLAFEGLPSPPLQAFICHGRSILRLKENQETWDVDQRRSQTTSVFITNLDVALDYTGLRKPNRSVDDPLLSAEFYSSFDRLLVGNAFHLRGQVEPHSATLPPGQLRVMALVEADQAFAPRAEGLPDVQGCVLYVIDLPVSEN